MLQLGLKLHSLVYHGLRFGINTLYVCGMQVSIAHGNTSMISSEASLTVLPSPDFEGYTVLGGGS